MRHSTQTHVTSRCQERNNVSICTNVLGLLAEYYLRDMLSIHVTQLEFFNSPMAGESTAETLKEILSTNADATEKMQPIVDAVRELDHLSHIQLNLSSDVFYT